MTNGDRIRQMSDEELFADYLYAINCSDCDLRRKCDESLKNCHIDVSCADRKLICEDVWLEWLGKEVESECQK